MEKKVNKKIILVSVLNFMFFNINSGPNEDILLASKKGNFEQVKLAIEKGADVKSKNKFGNAPIHHATRHNNIDLLRLLINANADVNSTNILGETPLYLAKKEIAEILIDNAADVNARSNGNLTPLHRAVVKKDKETAKLLLSKGAIVDAQDDYGWTPLHDAASINNKDMVELLLKSGANKDIKDFKNRTASDVTDSWEIKILINNFVVDDISLDELKKHNNYPEAFKSYWSKKQQNILENKYIQLGASRGFKQYITDFIMQNRINNGS